MDELSIFDKSKIFTEYPPENQIELYDPNIAIYLKLEKEKMSLKKIQQTIKVLKKTPGTKAMVAARTLEGIVSRAEFTDPHSALTSALQKLVDKHGTIKKRSGGLIGNKLVNSLYTGIK